MKLPKWTKQVSPPAWGRVVLAGVPLLLLVTFFVLAGDEYVPLYVMFLVPMATFMLALCVYFPSVKFSEVLPWLGAMAYFFGRMFWDTLFTTIGWAAVGTMLSLLGFGWTLASKVPFSTVHVIEDDQAP